MIHLPKYRRRGFISKGGIILAASVFPGILKSQPVTPNRRLNFRYKGDLQLQCESDDFDGVAGGTAVTNWIDHSGWNHNWSTNVTNVVTDQTITANGHATLKFNGTSSTMQQPFFLNASGYTGIEVMCVVKIVNDPPLNSGNGGDVGNFFCFNHGSSSTAFPPHHPYTDSNIYEVFGVDTRFNAGNPTPSLSSAFRLYNVSSAAANNAYDIWVDTQNLQHLTGSYTFQSQGYESQANSTQGGKNYACGVGYRYDTQVLYYMNGNMAALYLWSKVLSTAERAVMRTYFNTKYGTAA